MIPHGKYLFPTWALCIAAAGCSLSAPARTAEPAAACPALRWTTLGTAGGPIPTPERAEPSNLLTAGPQQILVDAGDGTVNQLARVGLVPGAIRTVFISHHHMDHTGGLAAVIGLRWMNQFPGVLTVYGPPGTRELVGGIVASMAPQARVGFGLGEPDRPPGDSVQVIELRDGETIQLGALTVKTIANSHFDQDPRVAGSPLSLSYRFSLDGRSITYTGDTGPSAAVATLARGADLLVSEVMDFERLFAELERQRRDATPETLRNLRRHLTTHHLASEDVGRLAAEAGVRRVVLTHFAIPPGPLSSSEMALREGLARHYAGTVDLARDVSTFDLGCRAGGTAGVP